MFQGHMPPGYVMDEMRMYEIGCLMPFLYLASKDSWEQARLMGYISAQTHSTKKMNVSDIVSFPWEEIMIRVGIGNDFSRGGQIDFVLGDLSEEEKAQVPELAARVIQGVKDISTIGVGRAMNTLNVKPKTPKMEEKPENRPQNGTETPEN